MRGFTLIEVLVAISVVGIISGLTIATFSGATDSSEDAANKLAALELRPAATILSRGGFSSTEDICGEAPFERVKKTIGCDDGVECVCDDSARNWAFAFKLSSDEEQDSDGNRYWHCIDRRGTYKCTKRVGGTANSSCSDSDGGTGYWSSCVQDELESPVIASSIGSQAGQTKPIIYYNPNSQVVEIGYEYEGLSSSETIFNNIKRRLGAISGAKGYVIRQTTDNVEYNPDDTTVFYDILNDAFDEDVEAFIGMIANDQVPNLRKFFSTDNKVTINATRTHAFATRSLNFKTLLRVNNANYRLYIINLDTGKYFEASIPNQAPLTNVEEGFRAGSHFFHVYDSTLGAGLSKIKNVNGDVITLASTTDEGRFDDFFGTLSPSKEIILLIASFPNENTANAFIPTQIVSVEDIVEPPTISSREVVGNPLPTGITVRGTVSEDAQGVEVSYTINDGTERLGAAFIQGEAVDSQTDRTWVVTIPAQSGDIISDFKVRAHRDGLFSEYTEASSAIALLFPPVILNVGRSHERNGFVINRFVVLSGTTQYGTEVQISYTRNGTNYTVEATETDTTWSANLEEGTGNVTNIQVRSSRLGYYSEYASAASFFPTAPTSSIPRYAFSQNPTISGTTQSDTDVQVSYTRNGTNYTGEATESGTDWEYTFDQGTGDVSNIWTVAIKDGVSSARDSYANNLITILNLPTITELPTYSFSQNPTISGNIQAGTEVQVSYTRGGSNYSEEEATESGTAWEYTFEQGAGNISGLSVKACKEGVCSDAVSADDITIARLPSVRHHLHNHRASSFIMRGTTDSGTSVRISYKENSSSNPKITREAEVTGEDWEFTFTASRTVDGYKQIKVQSYLGDLHSDWVFSNSNGESKSKLDFWPVRGSLTVLDPPTQTFSQTPTITGETLEETNVRVIYTRGGRYRNGRADVVSDTTWEYTFDEGTGDISDIRLDWGYGTSSNGSGSFGYVVINDIAIVNLNSPVVLSEIENATTNTPTINGTTQEGTEVQVSYTRSNDPGNSHTGGATINDNGTDWEFTFTEGTGSITGIRVSSTAGIKISVAVEVLDISIVLAYTAPLDSVTAFNNIKTKLAGISNAKGYVIRQTTDNVEYNPDDTTVFYDILRYSSFGTEVEAFIGMIANDQVPNLRKFFSTDNKVTINATRTHAFATRSLNFKTLLRVNNANYRLYIINLDTGKYFEASIPNQAPLTNVEEGFRAGSHFFHVYDSTLGAGLSKIKDINGGVITSVSTANAETFDEFFGTLSPSKEVILLIASFPNDEAAANAFIPTQR